MADKKTPGDETPNTPKAKDAARAPAKKPSKKAASSRTKAPPAAKAAKAEGVAASGTPDVESPYRDETSRLTTATAAPDSAEVPASDLHRLLSGEHASPHAF